MTDRDAMMMNGNQEMNPGPVFTEVELSELAKIAQAGRPAWDFSGIMAALRRIPQARLVGAAPEQWFEWACSAVRCAAGDRSIRLPAVIPLAGKHWTSTKPVPRWSQASANRGPLCYVCQGTLEIHDHKNAIVAEEDRHDWLTDEEHQAKVATFRAGQSCTVPDLLAGLTPGRNLRSLP